MQEASDGIAEELEKQVQLALAGTAIAARRAAAMPLSPRAQTARPPRGFRRRRRSRR